MTASRLAVFVRSPWGAAAVLLALALAGCATAPPASSPAKVELPFDQAVAQATDGLVAQARQQQSTFLSRLPARPGVVLDPMVDAGSAQQTAATQRLQAQVTERLRSVDGGLELLPFQRENLARARYLLTGTMTRVAVGDAHGPLRIELALTELANGTVAARSSALARDPGLDHTPLPYDQDTPVPLRDKVVESYVRTTATPAGRPADPYYIERLAAAPAITEGTRLYNTARYEAALAQYNAASSSQAGEEQLRVLNGIYLSSAKLGRTAEAEQAFGRILALGIAQRQLGVKFLFNPGGTLFWSDPRISGPYPMWLREIARASTDAKVCMDIVGHTSRTGTVAFNDALSLQRARLIRERLVGESAVLAGRTTPSGKGFRENVIGSGSDDAVDALDRRVEFRIVGCT